MHIQQQDTTVALWDKLYHVSYPYFASRTLEDIQKNGVPTTGDKELDRLHTKELIRGYLPVASKGLSIIGMVIDRGVQVNFITYTDVFTVYDDIQIHLNAWQSHLINGMNRNKAVTEDLLKFDKLAKILFDSFVKFDTSRGTEYKSNFMRKLGRGLITGDAFSALSKDKPDEQAVKIEQAQYNSMEEFLLQRQVY